MRILIVLLSLLIQVTADDAVAKVKADVLDAAKAAELVLTGRVAVLGLDDNAEPFLSSGGEVYGLVLDKGIDPAKIKPGLYHVAGRLLPAHASERGFNRAWRRINVRVMVATTDEERAALMATTAADAEAKAMAVVEALFDYADAIEAAAVPAAAVICDRAEAAAKVVSDAAALRAMAAPAKHQLRWQQIANAMTAAAQAMARGRDQALSEIAAPPIPPPKP